MDVDYSVKLPHLLDETTNSQISNFVQLAQKVFDVPFAFVYLPEFRKQWLAANSEKNASVVIEKITKYINKTSTSSDPFDNLSMMDINYVEEGHDLHRSLLIKENLLNQLSGIAFKLQFKNKTENGIFCLIDTNTHEFDSREREIIQKIGSLIQNNICAKKDKEYTNKENLSRTIALDELLLNMDHCHRLSKIMDKELKKIGIQYKEWRVLDHIHKVINTSPVSLCKKLQWSNPLLCTYLDKLEDKELIDRKHMKRRDKRIVSLSCTEKGLEIWQAGWRITNEIAMHRLTDSEINVCLYANAIE